MIARILKTTSLITVFFLAAGISAYFALTFIIKSEDTVIVPDIVEKNLVYALKILSDLGLNTKVKGLEYSASVPKNHIIFQDPDPGSEIKKDRDVRVIISKGAKTIMMPNLEGLSIQQARIIIEENDLCIGMLSTTYHSIFKKETLISQTPLPGKLVTRESCVDLLISKGKRPVAYMMPDLTGIPLDDAILTVEEYNLVLGKIKSVFHENKPRNLIAFQEPLPGCRILEESIINLVINREPGNKKVSLLRRSGGVRLFKYRLGNGFLRKRIRVNVNCFGISFDLTNELVKPGSEIWTFITRNRDATLFLYEDNELIKTEVFDAW
ncbi:MAG: PASTA domain-containing protein [Deltaproteobacteria bacterium]|nr:PASTA domain-containing protein [Deltaproteobacteria bacterium]